MPGNPSPIHLSVAILCYQNGAVLEDWVRQVHRSLSSLNKTWELVLVANVWEGQEDQAQKVALSLEKALPHIRVLNLTKKGGYGWDVKAGLEACRGEVLAYVDGDGQISSEALCCGYEKLMREKLQLVKARRIRREDGWIRRVLSGGFNLGFRLFFGAGFKDINAKPKLFTREAYQKLDLQSEDWFIDAEIMLKTRPLNLSVGEFPITFHQLAGRSSLVGGATVWEFCKNFYTYRFKKKNRSPAFRPIL